MANDRKTNRWALLLAVAGVMGCQADLLDPEVAVTPRRATVVANGQQAFAAAPPTVTWSIRGSLGGTITPGGLYTAPGSTGQVTIVATETTTGAEGTATVTVVDGSSTVAFGMQIPPTHPRLYWNAERLARARAWYPSHPFNPHDGVITRYTIERATRGLLNTADPNDQRVQCRAALDWSIQTTASMAVNANGSSLQWDYARWYGEAIILSYDWCHAYLTPAEKAQFIADTNVWVERRRLNSWGGVPMHQNNYYWGFVRNQIEWGITSYEDNVADATRFLQDALVTRLQNDFDPATLTTSRGGVAHEGSEYGPYINGYAIVPYVTAGLLGRDMYDETNYWKESAYAFIYSTLPAWTTGATNFNETTYGWIFFPHSDSGNAMRSSVITNGNDNNREAGDFRTTVANEWPTLAVGRYSRQWLNMTGVPRLPHQTAVDVVNTPLSFDSLPLDYYSSGIRYLYTRASWASTATNVFLQLGDRNYDHIGGHAHVDWGTFQIWRKGRFLTRETTTYGGTVPPWNGGAATGALHGDSALPHNTILMNGYGAAFERPWDQLGSAPVTRLESRPGYSYASVDLSSTSKVPTYGNPEFVTWVREFVFFRGLETLVVLDRLQSAGASTTKTFFLHCEYTPTTSSTGAICPTGDQQLVMTNLLPAQRTYRVASVSGVSPSAAAQYRVELDTTPGTAQSYILTVLQGKDASATALTPTLEDQGDRWVVQLDGTNGVTFMKGMSSTGGSITVGGASNALRADAQGMVVTDAGPVWQ